MTNLVSREKLEYIARKVLHYPLHDAEKDYFLAFAMKLISESHLSKSLVFKGGTSIYHCYLEQLRFSEDLDFTSLDSDIKLVDVKKVFKSLDFFEIKKQYKSEATIKIEKLKYYGVLDVPNSIKIEVDYLQNVLLPPVQKRYQNVWGFDFTVNVMDSVEICAEKLRACNDRFRYRDFYDLYMMATILKIDFNKAAALLPKKEIRKPFSKNNIIENLNLALGEISTSGDTITYKKPLKAKDLQMFSDDLEVPFLEPNVNKLG